MLAISFLSLYQKFVSLNNQRNFEITPQADPSSLTILHTIKQHCFLKKKKKKRQQLLLLLQEEIILFSLFIIQTCLCTGKIPEMFHAHCVYGHFFWYFFLFSQLLLWELLHFFSACFYENIPEVSSHYQKLASFYF